MRILKKITIAVALIAAAWTAFPAAAAAWSFETMPVDQIKPGMKGYGLTVFKGAKPEKFDVEIIAVIKKWKSGNDMILIRCSGHNLEFTGIAAGMSGSPIYIDDKLIGALAFGTYWPKEAVAGVQPIAEMLRLWEEPLKGESSGSTGGILGGGLFDEYALKIWKQPAPATSPRTAPEKTRVSAEKYGEIELEAIKTPLLLSNLDSAAAEFIGKILGPLGVAPMLGGGEADLANSPGVDDLQAGSVIGSPLMTGDFKMTAIGTVTAREGDRLLAFGHPFFNSGPTALPMSGGEIYHFMSTLNWTFKMGATGRVLGAIVDDRATAISGQIGKMPDYFPVSIEIEDTTTGRNRSFNVQVCQVRELAPFLISGAVGGALAQMSGFPEEATVRMQIDGALEGYGRPFHFEETFLYPPDSYDFETVSFLFTLMNNPFKKTRLAEVKVKLTLERRIEDASMMSVRLGSSRFHPGDAVKAFVTFQHFDEGESVKTIEFRIPEDAQPGPLTIEFAGGWSTSGFASAVPVENFDQLFDALLKWIPRNAIIVKFTYPETAIGVEGRELQNLPPSILNSYIDGPKTQQFSFGRYKRLIYNTDRVVFGTARVIVNIEKEYQQ